MKYRIYLDCCCFNRPFDNQKQTRIFFEAEIIKAILDKCQSEDWVLINSDALLLELNQLRDQEKLENIRQLLKIARIKVKMSENVKAKTKILVETIGFTLYDAFHIASAEVARADVFLTTDDRLFKKAQREPKNFTVTINKPVQWIAEII